MSQISYFIFVSEVQVTYSGWLALLFSAFHLVLHKLFITSPEAGVAGERGVDHPLGSRSCWRKLTTDWRFGGRGGGGLQRSAGAGAGGHLTCFVIFSCIFPFLPLGRTLSISCYFLLLRRPRMSFAVQAAQTS